ncbi:hypothetical protein [Streptomyces sp. NPDC127084]|uniref:hypothetical protein n=1 Tax=Streptomyces sp. NPDC127084 TaxID=3347133 RepID=UPI00365D8E5F
MTLPMGEVPPNRPDYPPKTPPPPKRPVQVPRPETGHDPSDAQNALPEAGRGLLPGPRTTGVAVPDRVRARIANRRVANWALDARPWAASSAGPKAARHVAGQIEAWGYRPARAAKAAELTERLVAAALKDGGRRISVHLADQNQQALILVLSHQAGPPPADDELLTELANIGVVSCGVDTDRDGGGQRRWALIQL